MQATNYECAREIVDAMSNLDVDLEKLVDAAQSIDRSLRFLCLVQGGPMFADVASVKYALRQLLDGVDPLCGFHHPGEPDEPAIDGAPPKS